MKDYLFTSESVADGHPDKIADQISDAVLDEALRVKGNKAEQVRCACETMLKGKHLIIAGELSPLLEPSRVRELAQQVVSERVGYGRDTLGFDVDDWKYLNIMEEQASEIGEAVNKKDGDLGAGDQGLMFGYACDETPELMPLALSLSHALLRRQKARRAELRLGPDAKAQVTVRYENGRPAGVEKIVVSTQHAKELDGQVEKVVREGIIAPVLAEYQLADAKPELLINRSGSFVEGGPKADAGLTGRKIIVDTYGGKAPHGGGAFSGKDPTKVDRSAAYMARYIAKTVVRHKLATSCLVQLSYVIGDPSPLNVTIDARGGAEDAGCQIRQAVLKHLDRDLSTKGIIDKFKLFAPNGWCYLDTAAFGHFGRAEFPWENPVEGCAFDSWCREQAPA